MNLPLSLTASLAQRGQKPLAVFVVPENILTLVPAVHDVISRRRVLNARLRDIGKPYRHAPEVSIVRHFHAIPGCDSRLDKCWPF